MEDRNLEKIENPTQEKLSPEQAVESQVKSPKTPKPKPCFKIGVVATIVLLLLGAIGYLVYQTQVKRNASWVYDEEPVEEFEYDEEMFAGPGETAGWKKYADERYGFSFSYPPLWSIYTGDVASGQYMVTITTKGSPIPGDLEILYGADFDVFVPEATPLSLDEWVGTQAWIVQPEGETPIVKKGLQLNGENALEVHICQVGCSMIIYAKHNGFIFGLRYFIGDKERDQHEKTINQILSTFKFID